MVAMSETDDRLAGDLVWELFPQQTQEATRSRRIRFGIACVFLVGLTWFLYPPLSVTLACLAISFRDFQTGRRLARTIPDKAGGRICALFTYAWAAWKFGVTAFVLMWGAIVYEVSVSDLKGQGPPPVVATAMLLLVGGFLASSICTAAGLVKAFRSGMRVWVGEGINQARTLLLGMLVVAFTFFVLVPMCLWLARNDPRGKPSLGWISFYMFGFLGSIFVGPFMILVVLDWISRRVVADRPGKFGPKVPTVGKWNA